MPIEEKVSASANCQPPLVVDLDGTLLRSDLLVETGFACVAENPFSLFSLLKALAGGRAHLEAVIAQTVSIDPAHLPYDDRVISTIKEARAAGRKVYLASASNERFVENIARHLGLFHGWFASSGSEHLSPQIKADKLVEAFGQNNFDYISNGRADLAIWKVARKAFSVGASPAVDRGVAIIDPSAPVIAQQKTGLGPWIKLLRVHQWSKNLLVLLPLVAAHQFEARSFLAAVAAFFIFCLAASAIYIINDIVDLDADRKHPSKKFRPLAAGTLPIRAAFLLAPVLLLVSVTSAVAMGYQFWLVLCSYVLLSTAYTFFLKKKMMIDVVTLAALYTARVIAGAAAISVAPSEWLLAFSMSIFTCLALLKRYVELAARADADLPDPTNRNYRKSDLGIVAALAAASGFNAVTVFALYISSNTVRQLYAQPQLLWLICPILIYWIGRVLFMAHRRLMNDDPIIFAMKDWNSLLAAGLAGAIMFAAK